MTIVSRSVLCFVLLSCCAIVASAEESRVWRDRQGVAFEASVLAAEAESVVLKSTEFGDTFTIPVSFLSESDRAFVMDWMHQNPSKVIALAKSPPKDNHSELEEHVKDAVDSSAVPDNFDAKWPGVVSLEEKVIVTLVKESIDEKKFVYQSNTYEIISDVRLNPSLVQKFTLLFESTREYCRLLPLSLKKAAIASDKQRMKILVFESFGTYVKNGGPPDSAGVYMPGKDIVLVPLSSLGVRKVGSSYSYNWDKANNTLPHELTHQLTDSCYYAPGARGWFSEGLAEYVATTPYRSGKFNNKLLLGSAKDFVTEYGRQGRGGRALGDDISLPFLKQFFLQDYSDFTANGNFNYGVALLVTYYFFHMDRDGDRSAIRAFLEALRSGKEGEDALETLLDGRTYEELQDELSRAWRTRGIRIRFERSISDS